MVAQILQRSTETLQSFQNCKAFIERLKQEIEDFKQEKKTIEKTKKYTTEIKKNISRLQVQIESNQKKIIGVQKMLTLFPGSWVRNGTTKPGKVIDLVVSGRIPEVHVQWHGASISVPESPLKLTLVGPELVEYVWYGDRYPKLVRRLDGWECDEIAILDQRLAESVEDKEDPNRGFKITYCKKRIALIDQEDLINLERAVRQGLAVFYRVGEALAEIRDRQLYKQHGYTDFREYLKHQWNMGKSQAYRLIDSSEVIKELKSVPNWGQNEKVLPSSEAVTREVAKLPPDQRLECWKKAVETSKDQNPTAAHTKAVAASFIDLPKRGAKLSTLQIDNFEVGQLVQIKSDRSDKRLVGYNLSVGIVAQVNPVTVNIKIWGERFDNLAPNDLTILDESKLPAICIAPNAEQYRILLTCFDSKEEIIKKAILS